MGGLSLPQIIAQLAAFFPPTAKPGPRLSSR